MRFVDFPGMRPGLGDSKKSLAQRQSAAALDI